MSSLRLSGVAVSRAGRDLLADVSFDLGPGFTGVVGANGSGKSTLLEVLAGTLAPDAGSRQLVPRDARVRLVPQTVERETPLPTCARLHGATRALLGRMGAKTGARAWSTLSPGERKRVQVATALADAPDVLLLDEPDNHLDAAALAVLVEALAAFRGLGVVVAHDRAFLDRLVDRVLWVESGRVVCHVGGFSAAAAAREAERRAARHELERRKRALRRSERALAEARRTSAESERQRSARARMKSPADADARSLGRQFGADRAAASHGSAVARRAEERDRAERARAALVVEASHEDDVELPRAPGAPPWLLRELLPALGHDGRILVGARRLDLRRNARVHVRGPNGAGKSTWLAAVAERWPHARERLFALPQEPDAAARAAYVATLRGLDPETRGRVLAWTARLGASPRSLLATPTPSPGEARKLALALALGTPTWMLLLDEPENHLDLPARLRLETALRGYAGAILVATHDATLAAAITSEAIDLTPDPPSRGKPERGAP